MTDHLADARACLSRVDQATTHFSAATWLTATCEHILDHLEAQNTPQEATSADLPASQPEPDQLGGGNFMGWMAGRLADPEVLAGYLAAHEREVREQVASELQQGDSGHRDGYTPTTEDVETWYVGNHDPAHAHEFRRWLAGIRAAAWDEGYEDGIDSVRDGLLAINPYRKEQP